MVKLNCKEDQKTCLNQDSYVSAYFFNLLKEESDMNIRQ